MPAFLYYLPGNPSTRDFAAARGYALGDGRIARTQTNAGPGDSPGGAVAADPATIDPSRVRYQPDAQTWKADPLGPGYVGFWTADPPTAETLARRPLIPGPTIRAAGQQWVIPKARQYEENADGLLACYNPLPCRLTLDEAGQWRPGETTPRCQALWRLAVAYLEAEAEAAAEQPDADVIRFSFDDLDDFALAALAVNYRVQPIEADLLGLYDLETRQQIVDAVLDRATLDRLAKKKRPDSATPPRTSPPANTSEAAAGE